MKLFLHLPDQIARFIPAPIIRNQYLRWRHALAREAQQTEFKGLGPVVCRDDRGYFHRMYHKHYQCCNAPVRKKTNISTG